MGTLTARQETGLLAVNGQHVRLGENLKQPPGFQVLDSRTQVDIGAEQENVQSVCQRDRGARRVRLYLRSAERTRADSPNRIGGAGAAQIDAQILSGRAIHVREAYL